MATLLRAPSLGRRVVRRLHSQSHTSVNYAPTPIHPDELTVQVFGSSTEVGKTTISAGLSLAALQDMRKVCYVKPVQTGQLDEYFIQFYTNPRGINDIFVRTLQHWSSSLAPHLAARQQQEEEEAVVTDQELLTNLQREMKAFVDSAKGDKVGIKPGKDPKPPKKLFTIIETAGGVLSPGPNKTLQADLYRSLRLPVLLVGDSRLGGISATLCAYESLRVRGYTVHAIVMIDRPNSSELGNKSFVQEHLESIYPSIPGDNASGPHAQAWSLGTPPKVFTLSPLPTDGKSLLHSWFKANEATFNSLFAYVRQSVALEWRSYNLMRERGLQQVWWPSTDHSLVKPEQDATFIESAHGDHVRTFSMQVERPASLESTSLDEPGLLPEPPSDASELRLRPLLINMFDATSSWWTQGVGHGHASMALAIGESAGRYGHLLYPLTLHPPVVTLSRYLVEKGPGRGWAQRVFYSDSGSSCVSRALTMAAKLHAARHGPIDAVHPLRVLTQLGGYHASTVAQPLTIGVPLVYFRHGKLAFDVKSVDSEEVRESLLAEAPLHLSSQVQNLAARAQTPLAQAYRSFVARSLEAMGSARGVGALLLEPLMLGAGSLRFIDPLFQAILVQEAKARGVPVVLDEVATGFYRLGVMSSINIFHETPDIACYSKVLSGGYLSLSTTLATEEVFRAFYPVAPVEPATITATSTSPSASPHASVQSTVLNNCRSDPLPAHLAADTASNMIFGNAYTANPIACSAALEAVRLLENCDGVNSDTGRMKPAFPDESVRDISKLPGVTSAFAMGTVLSIQLIAPAAAADSNRATGAESEPSLASLVISLLQAERVQAHPLNDNIYIMCTPMTSIYDRQRIVRVLKRCLTKAYYLRPSAGTNIDPAFPATAP